MRYNVLISADGAKIDTEVINREEHDCKEIVNVANVFGQVTQIDDKDDENPVRESTFIHE